MRNAAVRALPLDEPDTLDIFERAGAYVAPSACGSEAIAVRLTDEAITDAVRVHQGTLEHRRWSKRIGFAPVAARLLTGPEVAEITPPLVYKGSLVQKGSNPWVRSDPEPVPMPLVRRIEGDP